MAPSPTHQGKRYSSKQEKKWIKCGSRRNRNQSSRRLIKVNLETSALN